MTNCLFLSVFNKAYPCFFTARKRSLRQGNVFTRVCHSVHMGMGRACHTCPLPCTPLPHMPPPDMHSPLPLMPPCHACPPLATHAPCHTCPPCHAHPPMIWSMSVRYASYWNAFLFKIKCQGIFNRVEIGNPESIIILYCNVSKGRDEQFHAYI